MIYKIENLVERTDSLKNELISDRKIKEITQDNLNSIDFKDEFIVYFLVDWSGPERLARYKIFTHLKTIEGNISIYFIDGSNQNLNFISKLTKQFCKEFEFHYVGGHGTIIYIRNKKILDEIKYPHTIEQERIELKLNNWIKTIIPLR